MLTKRIGLSQFRFTLYLAVNMNALSIKGLTKTYKGGTEALKGIDLTVKQGDFFALLGPNDVA